MPYTYSGCHAHGLGQSGRTSKKTCRLKRMGSWKSSCTVRALELAPQRVEDGDVDLRPVERAVRGVQLRAPKQAAG